MKNHNEDKAFAINWARELLAADPRSCVILDTETTGLQDAEILQIGLLWPDGMTALDVLIEPDFGYLGATGIPTKATEIHGITDAMVRGCPTFEDVYPSLEKILHKRRVVIYNCDFDRKIIDGCMLRTWENDREIGINTASWECAMLQYAAFCGEPGKYGGYRWQKLPDIGGGPAHSAIGDCRSTLELIKRMAAG